MIVYNQKDWVWQKHACTYYTAELQLLRTIVSMLHIMSFKYYEWPVDEMQKNDLCYDSQ